VLREGCPGQARGRPPPSGGPGGHGWPVLFAPQAAWGKRWAPTLPHGRRRRLPCGDVAVRPRLDYAPAGQRRARLGMRDSPLVDDQRTPKPPAREREKLEVVGDTQQPPRDPEPDELAVGELRRTPRPPKVWGRGGHRSAHTVRQRGVEGVWREGLQGRRCDSNASFRRPPHRPIWDRLVRLLIGALSVPADNFLSTRLSGSLASVWGWLPLTRCGLGRRRARGRYGAGLAWCGRERRAAVEVQRCRPGFVSASAAPATSSSTMAAAGRTSLTMPALCPA
jgi:hypothetical protein